MGYPEEARGSPGCARPDDDRAEIEEAVAVILPVIASMRMGAAAIAADRSVGAGA
jgi:hypothetical protein